MALRKKQNMGRNEKNLRSHYQKSTCTIFETGAKTVAEKQIKLVFPISNYSIIFEIGE